MRCINKRRRRRNKLVKFWTLLGVLIGIGAVVFSLLNNKSYVSVYEKKNYQGSLYQCELPVDKLCVSTYDVKHSAFKTDDEFHAISLLDLNNSKFIFAENMHEKIFPASTTKLMTAYLALKNGNLEDTVCVTSNAQNIPIDSSRAGLRVGDQLSLRDLLYGLLLPSGNDAAIAVAEHIAPSTEIFVELMNQEAYVLGATNTHFVSPHGYHDEDHYTTAYDLYLIFQACMEFPEFRTIISSPSHSLQITQHNGTYRNERWIQSNWYITGNANEPDGMLAIGGKTGTTDEAGSCLITLFEDEEKNAYLAIVMGAESRYVIYDNINQMITATLQ